MQNTLDGHTRIRLGSKTNNLISLLLEDYMEAPHMIKHMDKVFWLIGGSTYD